MAPLNMEAIAKTGYDLQVDTKSNIKVCYFKHLSHPDGFWKAESPLVSSLSVLVMQLVLIMLFNHTLIYILRPLRQPRIVADIVGGVILGPTTSLGTNWWMRWYVIGFDKLLTLETVAHLGLVYYMFLVGLELDFRPVIRTGKKALTIAIAGISVAVPVGWALHYYILKKDFPKVGKWDKEDRERFFVQGPLFWGIALATTNFADLARILADLKLLHSEIGRLALSVAVLSDLFSWFLFLVAMTVMVGFTFSVVYTLVFIAIIVFLVRPALSWVLRRTTKGDGDNELQICFVLSGIVLCGFITEASGTHSIVGAFVLGAIMPKGVEIKNILEERVGYFVSNIIMPLFYLVVGLRFNGRRILNTSDGVPSETTMLDVVLAVVLAFTAKIIGTSIAALLNKMTLRDSLVLGVLMNTKGLMALIILNSSRDLKVLDQQMYAIMLVVIWTLTVPVGPILALTYKSTKRSSKYKLRNVQSVGTNTELKILACTHTPRNTSGMIDLIEASNPSEHSPISVFAVQLVELTGHAAAMLIVHDTYKTSSTDHNNAEESRFPSNAFENYALERDYVSVQRLTVVSEYATMHEDICTLAEEKRANLVLIPFHEKSDMDEGTSEDSNPSFMGINKNVIENSPCSVGVIVDRGLATSRMITKSDGDSNSVRCHKFALLFIGGRDDREALAYAWRMAGHSGVHLTVIRLALPSLNDEELLGKMENTRRQKQLDELYMEEFRLKSMNNPSIQLLEEQVTGWEDIHSLISAMEYEYAMCILGRGHGRVLFEETIMDCNDDSDELGVLGDVLVSSQYMTNTSILIVKQGTLSDEVDTMGYVEEQYGHTTWQAPSKNTTDDVIQTANL